ncbi:MAG: TonB-dependent receptor, partial [Chitinophagaceae bacterium]
LSQLRADIQWKTPRIKGTYLSIEYDQNFAQRRVLTAYDTETATRGYALWNASLGMEWHTAKQTLFTCTFSALNIFDVAYQSHLSRLKYNPENPLTGRRGNFNMGRNFSIRVIVPLQVKWKGK